MLGNCHKKAGSVNITLNHSREFLLLIHLTWLWLGAKYVTWQLLKPMTHDEAYNCIVRHKGRICYNWCFITSSDMMVLDHVPWPQEWTHFFTLSTMFCNKTNCAKTFTGNMRLMVELNIRFTYFSYNWFHIRTYDKSKHHVRSTRHACEILLDTNGWCKQQYPTTNTSL